VVSCISSLTNFFAMKKIPKFSTLFLLLLINTTLFSQTNGNQNAQNTVYINDVKIPQETLNQLSSYYNIQIIDGRYWYDNFTGAWGKTGGPCMGFVLPYMQLGGPLKANASNGNSGVFVNKRELHYLDVVYLQQFFKVIPGRYWLDAKGNGGYEGQYASFNLYQLAKQSGTSFYRNSYTGIGSGSSGGTSYVIGKDFSVITGD